MTTAPAPVCLPAFALLGEEVELTRIEKALQALFAGDGEGEGPGQAGIARASLINLALYNENPAGLEHDAEVLAELTYETACSSLLIHDDHRSTPDV